MNRTLIIEENEIKELEFLLESSVLSNHIIYNNDFKSVNLLNKIDLLFLDPPYNLNKSFGDFKFKKIDILQYTEYLDNVIKYFINNLKETATIYICGDWYSSNSIFEVASRYFKVRNRITWEREKGRGAKSNWKNSSEDIWFCTMSDNYTFNVDSVKLRRRVLAPYKQDNEPKDWQETEDGKFRDTFPSNLWTDITIPFWSMTENTEHPTQKSEKLLAKLILASTNPGDMVLDPFMGSGTTPVVAKKLNRNAIGIEINKNYCLLATKRLKLADENKSIQGFKDGIFYDRNINLK